MDRRDRIFPPRLTNPLPVKPTGTAQRFRRHHTARTLPAVVAILVSHPARRDDVARVIQTPREDVMRVDFLPRPRRPAVRKLVPGFHAIQQVAQLARRRDLHTAPPARLIRRSPLRRHSPQTGTLHDVASGGSISRKLCPSRAGPFVGKPCRFRDSSQRRCAASESSALTSSTGGRPSD